ncbi:GNAT family acetyltransferase [Aestuariimicrobium soli]|uniref:GNAT family acetyltransferase n=1 Tax=Aestuariimicrobium soli TaxID=2035834 RepID=UPI003EBBA346
MVPALAIGGGTLTLLVFVVLAAFVVIGWFSLRRNVRGIDFADPADEAPASTRSAEER